MKKNVLILALALVVAFASSAMAAVDFSGEFTATLEQDSFRVFDAPYTLDAGISFDVSAANDEDAIDWEFEGGINWTDESALEFGEYKLGLYDDYFSAWVWGNEAELEDKETYFD